MKCRIWHSIKHLDSFKSPFVAFSFFLSVFLYFLTAPPWGWGGGYLHCVFALAELCWHCFLLNRTTGRGRWRPWRSGWRRWSSHCTTSNCCLKRRSLSWRNRWVHSDNWTTHCIHWMWMIAKAKRHWGRRTATALEFRTWMTASFTPNSSSGTRTAKRTCWSTTCTWRTLSCWRLWRSPSSGRRSPRRKTTFWMRRSPAWTRLCATSTRRPSRRCLSTTNAHSEAEMSTVGSRGGTTFPEPIMKEKLQKKRAFFSATVVCLIVLCKLWVFFFLFFLSVLRMMKHQMEGHSNL